MTKDFSKQGEWTQKVFPFIPVLVVIVFLVYSFLVKDSIAYRNFHPFHWEDGVGLSMFAAFVLFVTGRWQKWFDINPKYMSNGTYMGAMAFGAIGLLLTLIR